ncbi:hypothetical protein GCM10018980_30340 [Streptomyces capoamus]|uniref:DUF3592 domain-containing protein n=1 Tax=Streptomyces capoamus TaxID=68183 RepID=A0A919EX41_9ACTN|nr:hypothetical protein GCM10010501_41250 [Streptomyces libani subsp. rufus]GHG49485.1 hypothetical protein GCM10018980_30340 [Streptomyces capoamus]
MGGPAIPVAVIAGCVLFFAWPIYRRGRALRTRGRRARARCVATRTENGRTRLLVQLSVEEGSNRIEVGLFKWPPVSVGGAVEVVYDPQDLSNVLMPDDVGTGRVALLLAIGSSMLLLFCVLAIVITFVTW